MQHSPRRAAGTRISRVPITGSQDHLSSPSLRTPVGGSIRRQVGSKSMKLFCRRGHMPTDGARAEVTRGSSAARHHDALCSRPHRIACRSVHHTFSQILPLNGPHMPPPAQSRPGPAVWQAPFGACSGACVLSASPSRRCTARILWVPSSAVSRVPRRAMASSIVRSATAKESKR